MIGWRAGVMLLIALIVVYIVALLLRLTRVGRRRPMRQAPEPSPAAAPTLEERAAPPPEPARRAPGFGEHLAEHLARSETEAEVQRLRAEIDALRAELEELRAARRVSPQYAEAMELSQRGLTAQDVADRLGISLAEAELVHALSRGDRNFDLGDEDGPERNADGDGHDGTAGLGR